MTARDLAKEWLRYAKSDLSTAVHMFNNVNPKETEISCYHAQQCAEKSLKAYLILKDVDPPRIHDLLELNQLCATREPCFSTVQQYCVLLNPYGVHVCYPNELAVDDTLVKLAIENAGKLFEFCDTLINGSTENGNHES
jgi:HEPN domain-containing protein